MHLTAHEQNDIARRRTYPRAKYSISNFDLSMTDLAFLSLRSLGGPAANWRSLRNGMLRLLSPLDPLATRVRSCPGPSAPPAAACKRHRTKAAATALKSVPTIIFPPSPFPPYYVLYYATNTRLSFIAPYRCLSPARFAAFLPASSLTQIPSFTELHLVAWMEAIELTSNPTNSDTRMIMTLTILTN